MAIIQLLEEQGYPYVPGSAVDRAAKDEVLIKDDLRAFLAAQYKAEGITEAEIESVIRQLETLPASDLYDSNKQFCEWLSDGFLLKREAKREDRSSQGAAAQKDLYIQLLDFSQSNQNIYKLVNQLDH